MLGVSLTHPVLALFLTWEFLLHIPRWPHFYAGSFSYTSRAVVVVFVCFLCWLLCVGSFSYTSCAGFLMWGVSLTHPVLASLCGEFLLHILCWLLCVGSFSYMYCASFFMWRVSLTHPMLAALCGGISLTFPC